ncbi:PP2C family protein-serine/threonine phosphatase [Noviherbaspirillum massiliense]|uniref:PP2C family protein-serine/threonine phosphatase n=1 Tax=Noviherbaspirillum massiliense TaxID=1465823 RepID=UPI00037BAB1F|nr:protein phosphatase 2C domain-containing protein [Noviherbaspirillum massiliense]
MQFRWTSASLSHTGRVRQRNEDACLDQPDRGIWAVADGMGGHASGDLASRMIVDTLNALPPPNDLLEFLAAARNGLQAVNHQLRTEAVNRNVPIIGSTVVVLLACGHHCGYLWVGDSRIYRLRNGRLKQLTRDHSQVEELMASGRITPEEALQHPARNLITRAIGADDLLELEEETTQAKDGDMFLLCSDGLSNEVSEQEMRDVLAAGDCDQAASALVDLALRHGGRDNISAVVVRAEDADHGERTVLNPAL